MSINNILIQPVKTIDEAGNAIHSKISAIKMPYQYFKDSIPGLQKLFLYLIGIYKSSGFKEIDKSDFNNELGNHLDDYKSFDSRQQQIFADLTGDVIGEKLSDIDASFLYSKAPSNSIEKPFEEYVQNVKTEYSQYKKAQKYHQLRAIWEKLSGTNTPMTWSEKNRLPVLCLFENNVQVIREVFDLINVGHGASVPETKIETAIKILNTDPIIKQLNDSDYCDETFKNMI
jgi:hypothetical protein